VITNKDLEVLIKMENLIGIKSKELFGKNKDKSVIVKWFDDTETVITVEDFLDYMVVIEKIIEDKKRLSDKSNKYNKENKEYHKIMNSISYFRKNGNSEKLEFWEMKLREYKEKKI
jgi:hypothetical protein